MKKMFMMFLHRPKTIIGKSLLKTMLKINQKLLAVQELYGVQGKHEDNSFGTPMKSQREN